MDDLHTLLAGSVTIELVDERTPVGLTIVVALLSGQLTIFVQSMLALTTPAVEPRLSVPISGQPELPRGRIDGGASSTSRSCRKETARGSMAKTLEERSNVRKTRAIVMLEAIRR
jgi:hypothetical protein